MAEPFMGEIKLVAWSFAARNWAFCDGRLLAISQNQALFSLLGTSYGGDGVTTFKLPDLRGRVPVHTGTGAVGTTGGAAQVPLTAEQVPIHGHPMNAAGVAGASNVVTGTPWLAGSPLAYGPPPTGAESTTLIPSTVGNEGGGAAHENRQPYMALNYVIALQGIYPSRS